MQVDAIREVCRVVTMKGQKLDSVYWLRPYGGNERQGDFYTPRVGDRAVIEYGLGYPVIVGYLPRPQTGDQSFPLDLDSGQRLVDTGTYASSMGFLTSNASKPKDSLLGDRLITSQGGGLMGVLRAGSTILRSSKAAEIFTSRLKDLVRIVSRNFEHFTDLSTNVYKNIRGRVYRYYGLSRTYGKTKDGVFNYRQYHGDVELAEAIKDDYVTLPDTLPDYIPMGEDDGGPIIFKEQVADDDGTELMHRTVSILGQEDTRVTNGLGFSHSLLTSKQLYLSFNDQNEIILTDPKIEVIQRMGHTITLTDGAIVVDHASGGMATLNGSTVELTYPGGASVKLDGSGVYSTYNGHFCNVTGSGVQLG